MLLEKELQKLVTRKVPVRVITINGFQMAGRLLDADSSAVAIDCGDVRKVVNMSAISTIEITKG